MAEKDMRARLIELLKKADKSASDKYITDYEDAVADNADYLLASGVLLPPCKVGDTVNEIIKALRCCAGEDLLCRECTHYKLPFPVCKEFVAKDAIYLISRQNAENDALIAGQETLQKNLPKVIKTEAIKEFAERLKESKIEVDVSYGYGIEHYTEAVAVVEIDRLVKEMTEAPTT